MPHNISHTFSKRRKLPIEKKKNRGNCDLSLKVSEATFTPNVTTCRADAQTLLNTMCLLLRHRLKLEKIELFNMNQLRLHCVTLVFLVITLCLSRLV